MSRKSRERWKDRVEAKSSAEAKTSPASVEALKRRRNRRFLFVAIIGISFPILELIAYQFRVITITVVNRSDQAIRGLKVSYDGGAFEAPELKPGASLSRQIRPDFTFKSEQFSTYKLAIRFAGEDGGIFNQSGRAGALDYSAQEVYTITKMAPVGRLQLQLEHTTRPGFPLSLVRDVMERLGFG